MAGFAEGLIGGVNAGTNLANMYNQQQQTAKLNDLRQQQVKLQQLDTIGKIMTMAQTDPRGAGVLMGSFVGPQGMNLPPDVGKGYTDFITKASASTLSNVKDILTKVGLDADPAHVDQAVRAGPINLMTYVSNALSIKSKGAINSALAPDTTSTPPTGAAPSPAPAPGQPAPAAPQVTPEQMQQVLASQESGGNAAAPTSANRAVGKYQITPDTFARYMPGVPADLISDPEMNETAGKKIINTLHAKYNGDPGRIATAYFSGDGNVAPAGSPTPYINDAADANGKKVSDYVGDVRKRILGLSAGSGSANTGTIPHEAVTALGAPPANALPGLPDGHAAPGAGYTPDMLPALRNAQIAQQINQKADKLQATGDAGALELAEKLRTQANTFESKSIVTLKDDNPLVAGLNLKPGTVIQYNLATKQPMTILQQGEDQDAPMTADVRAKLNASGANLDPARAYSWNPRTQKATPLDSLTNETSRTQAASARDAAKMKEVDAMSTSAQDSLKQSANISSLIDRAALGRLGPLKQNLAEWGTALGIDTSKLVNVPAGQALESAFNAQVVDRVHGMGRLSTQQDMIVKSAGGALNDTPEGLKFIQALRQREANQQLNAVDIANTWNNLPKGPSTVLTAQDAQANPKLAPFVGKNYYQAEKDIMAPQPLTPEMDSLLKGVDQQAGAREIADVHKWLPNLASIQKDQAEVISKHLDQLSTAQYAKFKAMAQTRGW